MDIRTITDQLSVSPQIQPEDISNLAEHGFRSVICNRPDGETVDQPAYEEIAAAAREAGMETLYLPIISGHLHENDIAVFKDALDRLPGPILAFCRSGTRSTMVWALAKADSIPAADIIQKADAAGYNVRPLF